MNYQFVFFFFIGLYLLQLLAALVVGIVKKPNLYAVTDKISSFSIVVPFKNEALRINGLLKDIQNLKIPDHVQTEFIFVDDHSIDNSSELITKLLPNAKILKNGNAGKKRAIQTGVMEAENEFILTWDADIRVKGDYLIHLSELPKADMWILPVEMSANNLIAHLARIDFTWLQLLTQRLIANGNPFLANGANLLFRKESFISIDTSRNDYSVESGDDMFLVSAFRTENMIIRGTGDLFFSVQTPAEESLSLLFKQRKRWTGKMKNLWTPSSLLMALFLGLIAVSPYLIILFAILFNCWTLLALLIFKVINEYLFLRFYSGTKNMLIDFPMVIMHQFYYPVFLLGLQFYKAKLGDRWG